MSQSPTDGPILNPLAVPIADAVRLLSRLGNKPLGEAKIRADIESGAPVNSDGTLNLVEYAAWLVREMGREMSTKT
jgi:hypothetical protein